MSSVESRVKDVMVKSVLAADLNTNARDCAKLMATKGVSCAVVTQGGAAVGIVTERDLVSKVMADGLDAAHVLVRDIMSTPLITVNAEAMLSVAAGIMTQYRVRRLVVAGEGGAMVGIVTTGDIARNMAEEHGYREATLNAMARYKEGVEGGPYQ